MPQKTHPSSLISIILLIGLLLVLGCSPVDTEAEDQPIAGQLLLWHPFPAEDGATFNRILDEYENLNGVKIVREFIPPEEMQEEYEEAVSLGLGPDIFIISQPFVGPIIRSGFVRELDEFDIDTSIFVLPSQRQIRWQSKLYGVPLSMITSVLCYNRDLVDEPPTTLTELVDDTRNGQRLAIYSNFASMFWGIALYEGRLLNESGKVALSEGGYAEWMAQLQEIRNIPSVIMQDDAIAVRTAFTEGQAAYYVCFSAEIPTLRQAMGADKLGVAPLPQHNDNAAGALMGVNTLFINRLSTESNALEAVDLINFLTNAQQQTRLALDSEAQIPVNFKVNIDPQLSPTVAALVEQSRTAVAFPFQFQPQSSLAINVHGEEYYTLVLEGEVTPEEAAVAITEATHRDLGIE